MTRLSLFLLGLVVLGACDSLTHEPSGENSVEVNPTPTSLVVDLGSAPDTLVVWDDVTFQYSVSTEPGRGVNSIELRFGDQVVAQTTDRRRAEVSTSVVPDGTYTLRLVTTAPAGTGSLADTLGAETQTVEATRAVVVDNAPVEPTPVSFGERDGKLEVRWEARPRPSFERYRLLRIKPDGGRTLVLDTEDPTVTSWVDPTFFSGRAAFAVDVSARGQMAVGDPIERTFEPPTLVDTEPLGGDRVRFRWTAAPFPALFDGYEVTLGGLGPVRQVASRVESVEDTTVVVDMPNVFGATFRYEFRTRRRPYGGFVEGGQAPSLTIDPMAPIDNVFGAADGALIGVSGTNVARVSPSDFSTLATFPVEFLRDIHVGRSGRVAVFSATPPPYRAQVSLLDGSSLSVLGQFIQEEVFGDRMSLMNSSLKALTDDGRLLSSYGEYWSPTYYGNLGVLHVDMMDGAIVNRIDATGTRPPSFSVNYNSVEMRGGTPDGRYVLFQVRREGVSIYETMPDGTFERRTETDTAIGFVFVDNGTAARLRNGRIELLDLPSLTMRSSFPVPEMEALGSYDAQTNLFVGTGSPSSIAPLRLVAYGASTQALAFDVVATYPARYVAGFLWADGLYRRVAPLL